MNRKLGDVTVRDLFLFAGAVLLVLLLFRLSDILFPFAVSLGLAYLLNPVLENLERHRIGRMTGIWLVLFVLLMVFSISVVFLVPAVQREVMALVQNAPLYIDRLQRLILPLLEGFGISVPESGAGLADFLLERLRGTSPEIIPQVAGAVFMGMKGTFGVIMAFLNLLIIPVITFYLLKDFSAIKSSAYSFIPRGNLPRVSSLLGEIDQVLSCFVRGQLIVCLILGVLYSAGLLLVGIDLALIIGLVSGLVSFIPYLGLLVGMVVATVMAVVQFGDFFHPLMVVAVFTVVQALEGTVISPKIVGEKVGLHPVAIILAVMMGGALMGFMGILIAVPTAAAINVLIRHAADEYRGSSAYRGAK